METKFSLDNVPVFYQTYVKLVNHLSLNDALKSSMDKFETLVKTIPEDQGQFKYAEGKWTIKELLLHVVDAERIFCYRALRFSRNDSTMLPGFDENSYVPASGANERTIKSILESAGILRKSTQDLFDSFTKEMLSRRGSANNTEISVETLGYVVAGHQLHHCRILEERYLKK